MNQSSSRHFSSVNLCFKGITAVVSAGALATLLVGLSASRLFSGSADLLKLAWLLLPYLLTIFCAWWWISDGVWRGLSLLAGSLAVTVVGLYHLGQAWFFSTPEVAGSLLQRLPWIQLGLVAAMLVLAFVPGIVFTRTMDRLARNSTAADGSEPVAPVSLGPESADKSTPQSP
jgi:hypothetical protein